MRPSASRKRISGLKNGVATLPGASHIGHGVVDNYISMEGKVGPYLLNNRKPDFIMRGASVSSGTTVPQSSILDEGYRFFGSVLLPPRNEGLDGYMIIWKRKD